MRSHTGFPRHPPSTAVEEMPQLKGKIGPRMHGSILQLFLPLRSDLKIRSIDVKNTSRIPSWIYKILEFKPARSGGKTIRSGWYWACGKLWTKIDSQSSVVVWRGEPVKTIKLKGKWGVKRRVRSWTRSSLEERRSVKSTPGQQRLRLFLKFLI